MDKKYNTDNMDQLMNKGWADMKKKLDHALPAHSKKSRRFFPVIILLFLALSIGGTMIYFNFNKSNQQAVPSQDQQPDTINFASGSTDHPASEAYMRSDEEPAVGNTLTNAQEKDLNNKIPGSVLLKPEITQNKFKEKSENSTKLPDLKLDKKRENTIHTNYSAEEVIRAQELVSLQQDVTPESAANIKAVTFHKLAYSDRTLKTMRKDTDQWINPGKWLSLSFAGSPEKYGCSTSYSFNLGVISENAVSFGGYEAGLYIHKKITPFWFFNTGLVYKVHNKKQFANSIARTGFLSMGKMADAKMGTDWVEKRYHYELLNSEIQNNLIGYEYVMGLVSKLHYADLPVRIGLELKKWRAFGGANLSVLVSGTNEVRDFSEQYFNTIVLSDKVLYNKDMFNRLDVSLQTGLEYNIYKGLSLYGYYNHGFKHLIKAPSAFEYSSAGIVDRYADYGNSTNRRIDRNRYIVFGLKYGMNACSVK